MEVKNSNSIKKDKVASTGSKLTQRKFETIIG